MDQNRTIAKKGISFPAKPFQPSTKKKPHAIRPFIVIYHLRRKLA